MELLNALTITKENAAMKRQLMKATAPKRTSVLARRATKPATKKTTRKPTNATAVLNGRLIWDLRRQCVSDVVNLRDRLMRAGLYATFHVFDATVKKIGWELAELGGGNRCPISRDGKLT